MGDHVSAIEVLLTKRDYKRAEVLIARLLRGTLDTESRLQLLIIRARTRLATGRIDDALVDLQKVRSLRQTEFDQPHLLELWGDCHLARFERAPVGFSERSDIQQSRSCYEHIVHEFPTYPNLGWIHYQIGRIFLTEHRTAEASGYFQNALLEPSTFSALTPFCYERLGFIEFYELRHLERALHFLGKAVDTYPSQEDPTWLAQVHTLRSRVLREMRRLDEAVEASRMAINIASASDSKRGVADALLTIGEILLPLPNREKETIQYLQQFIQISKKPLGIDVTWARVYEMLGDLYYRIGQYANSLASYDASLQYNPYTPWEMSMHYRLARTAYQAGEYERALHGIERMIRAAEKDGESVEDHRVFALRGNAHYALDQYGEAIKAYEQAKSLASPKSPDLETINQYLQFALNFARRV